MRLSEFTPILEKIRQAIGDAPLELERAEEGAEKVLTHVQVDIPIAEGAVARARLITSDAPTFHPDPVLPAASDPVG